MKLPSNLLLASAIAIMIGGATVGVNAQQTTDKPFDFKPLLPPLVPVPPNSSVTSGAVGGTQNPYTTAPLQSPTQGSTQPAPGMRFSIPTR